MNIVNSNDQSQNVLSYNTMVEKVAREYILDLNLKPLLSISSKEIMTDSCLSFYSVSSSVDLSHWVPANEGCLLLSIRKIDAHS